MLNLKLGDVVLLGGESYVVATITGLPPYWWQLVRVPAGQDPLALGTTWSRSDAGVVVVSLTLPSPPPPSAALEPPTPPPGSPSGAPEGDQAA